MRYSLFARLLLVFSLLFVQTGSLVHGISHALADQTQDQSLPHDKHCDLCAAYAQLGSALGSHGVAFTPADIQTVQIDASLYAVIPNTAFTAFVARAPPTSA